MNNQDTDSIHKFLNNYRNIQVQPKQTNYYAAEPDFNIHDYSDIQQCVKTRVVKNYSFEILEHELVDLATIVNQHNREKDLRRRYSALKKAYEQYKIMLNLIESEEQYYGRK